MSTVIKACVLSPPARCKEVNAMVRSRANQTNAIESEIVVNATRVRALGMS